MFFLKELCTILHMEIQSEPALCSFCFDLKLSQFTLVVETIVASMTMLFAPLA